MLEQNFTSLLFSSFVAGVVGQLSVTSMQFVLTETQSAPKSGAVRCSQVKTHSSLRKKKEVINKKISKNMYLTFDKSFDQNSFHLPEGVCQRLSNLSQVDLDFSQNGFFFIGKLCRTFFESVNNIPFLFVELDNNIFSPVALLSRMTSLLPHSIFIATIRSICFTLLLCIETPLCNMFCCCSLV